MGQQQVIVVEEEEEEEEKHSLRSKIVYYQNIHLFWRYSFLLVCKVQCSSNKILGQRCEVNLYSLQYEYMRARPKYLLFYLCLKTRMK